MLKNVFTINKLYHYFLGSNKKLAKNAASAAALNKLRNYHLSEDPTQFTQQFVSGEDQQKADKIGR